MLLVAHRHQLDTHRLDPEAPWNRFALGLFFGGVASRPPGGPKTINIFLCSPAEKAGQRAMAVILSGLDGEGSAALQAIKAAGGVTFVQSDAAYDSMPRSAVETGHVKKPDNAELTA